MAEIQPLKLVPEVVQSSAARSNGVDDKPFSGQVNGDFEASSTTNPQSHRFDPDFTQTVINAASPKASPRMRSYGELDTACTRLC